MANFTRLTLVLLFRITCWCLVTSSVETINLLIGLIVCLLIPFGDFRRLKMHALIPEILLILRLPYDMIKECFELMLISDPIDKFTEERVNIRATSGSKFAEFFDLFRITFTPMSLVTRRENSDVWRVHLVASASEMEAKVKSKESKK